jgi:DNA-binding NarL/FixJ family response regulator
MLKIALIEDDALYRLGVEKVIHFQPNMKCLISADSPDAFWKNLPHRAQLDLIFLDIAFPADSGVRHIPKLKKQFPEGEIVMLTRFEQPDLLFKSLSMGASGYLIKDFEPHKIIDYIKINREGGALISPKMARFLVEYLNPPKQTPLLLDISSREVQILRLFSEGNTYDETAKILDISVNAIRYHIKNIYKKFGVDNKYDALKYWQNIEEL